MPNGVPVATVALNAAQNAGILAAQIIGASNESLMKKIIEFKEQLKQKIELANQELKKERTKRA
jgi:5-(carboxyamino)imidazole ribonucleotide mutase